MNDKPTFLPDELAAWSVGRWTRAPSAPLAGVVHDTGAVSPGCLFVALCGHRFDGHAFVPQAAASGAAAALVREGYAPPPAVAALPLLRVDDTRLALMALGRGYRRTMAATITGITGSVGKTTVKEMTADVLARAGRTARNRGNWNNDIGLPASLLETPSAVRHGVFEIGMNHPGELAPLCDVLAPDRAVITRVGPVHLEFFPSERAIAEEKAVLAAAVPPSGFVVLCPDEPWFDVLRAATRARVVTISMEGPADYAAVPASDGAVRVRERDGLEWVCPVPIPGRPARLNALRAAAVGRESGVAPADVADALASFRPPSMRWAEETAGGVRWINDAYNANPVSLAAALETFADLPVDGAKWLVLGGMRELGEGGDRFHREAGAAVAGGPWAGLVAVGAAAAPYAEGAVAAGWPAARVFGCGSAAAAAAILRERLRPGDAVLLKGSRGERIEEVLNEWRKTVGAGAPEGAAAGG